MQQPVVASPPDSEFWLLRYRQPIFFFVIIISIAGIVALQQVPISVFPLTNFPRIIIGVDNGVMPVEQMQVTITRPIEEAINTVPGLETIRSTTSRGSADISLFFNWNVDMFQTLQRVNAALSEIRQTLPSTAVVTANRLTFSAYPILGFSLTSNTLSQTELWQLAYYKLKPPLNRVAGVRTVVVQGGQVPEFHVVPNLALMRNAGVTITDLVNALQQSNIIQSPGLYQDHHELILGLVGAQAHDVSQLGNLMVKTTPGGAPVHVSDIATVKPGILPVYTNVTANGKPAVLLNISRQPSSNTVAVADAVHQELQELEKSLPAGVTVSTFYDQSLLVRESISSVRDAIIIGLVLACIVMFVFLGDWTSSVVAGLVIPITIAIAILFLWFIGQSFNLMTLGGLAAAVGLVIDDAIVVVENIVLHRDSGQSRIDATRLAIQELKIPLVGSTITPVVVFLPLISVSGVTGSFFRALAITMTAALLTSLMLALTWTPALSLTFLHKHAKLEKEHKSSRAMDWVIRRHAQFLSWGLRRPIMLFGMCALLVVGSYFAYKGLGSDLLPKMDEGAFTLDYIMPPGSSLAETNRVLNHVYQILHSIPEVESTSRRTGLQLGLAAVTEANTGDISVKLTSHRSRGIEAIMAEARARIKAAEPELDIEFTQLLQDEIGDLSNAPQPVQIKVYNNDPVLLNKLGPRIADAISHVPGVVDIENGVDNTISGPATDFRIDPAAAARMGFTPSEIALDATAILDGDAIAEPLISNGRPYTVRVRLGPDTRQSLDTIQNTVFTSATGKSATLGTLATITQLPPQNEILRENLQRLITVTARLEGTNLGAAIAGVKTAVNNLHLPPTVRIVYGGTYQTQQKSFSDLTRVLMLSLALVFGVLLIEFRNFSAPASILLSSVLSTAGVLFALLVTGITFNVASFMGIIMVIGIVAKNGILLLDADDRYREEGMPPREAMMQAAQRRLRPILMTATAAICGMLPLAFAIGSGSQMLQPLAIAVIGGLAISMVLSLIVTPAAYYLLTRHRAVQAPHSQP